MVSKIIKKITKPLVKEYIWSTLKKIIMFYHVSIKDDYKTFSRRIYMEYIKEDYKVLSCLNKMGNISKQLSGL